MIPATLMFMGFSFFASMDCFVFLLALAVFVCLPVLAWIDTMSQLLILTSLLPKTQ